MKARAFSGMNPTVPIVYGCIAAVIAMTALQPVLCIAEFLLVTLASAALEGPRTALRRLAWQVPMVLLIVLLNCAFVTNGMTVLWAGPFEFRAEALVFGLCSGLMLATTLGIFSILGSVVSSDEALSLLGAKAPSFALMASITLGMVPGLRRQAQDMRSTMSANTARASGAGSHDGEQGGGLKRRMIPGLGMVSTLMANSMEDSLVKADSMRARGWGGPAKRTQYRRRGFTRSDGFALAVVVLLAALAAWGAISAVEGSSIYPCMHLSPSIIPYAAVAAYFALPIAARLWEVASWRR